jgi:putative resolvase
LAVDQVVSEVGSGLDGRRRELTKVLSDPAVTVVVVEHRDVTEVLTSLCARRYGRCSASGRAAEAVAVATGGEPG